MEKKSILSMAMGAIEERVDYEMSRVIDNIIDPNTEPTAKRTIIVTLEIKPDSERQRLSLYASAKSKLVTTNPVATALYITNDENGEMCVVEMVPQVPGQTSIAGDIQDEPKILKLINRA